MKKQYKIVNSIENLRKEKQLTQQELAEKIGVSRQTIISIEKGETVPSLLIGMKISAFFNVCVEDVFYIRVKNS